MGTSGVDGDDSDEDPSAAGPKHQEGGGSMGEAGPQKKD